MNNLLIGKSKIPLQLKVFHTLLGLVVFFSLITIPAESQIISLFGMPISSDLLWWPAVIFILYIINSIYGFGYLRHSVYLVIIFRLTYLLFLKLAIWLPSSSFWKMQAAYTNVLDRDIFYILKSTFIFWLCSLVTIRVLHSSHKKSIKLVFFGSLILLTLLNTLLIYDVNSSIQYNLITVIFIYSFLLLIFGFLIKLISKIEKKEPINPQFQESCRL